MASRASEYIEWVNGMTRDEQLSWAVDVRGLEFSCILMECREAGDSQEEIDKLHVMHEAKLALVSVMKSTELKNVLEDSKNNAFDSIEEQQADEPSLGEDPFWPTGLKDLDDKTGGGGYGLTVFAGEPKVGKSILAMTAAVEAAKSGWRVIYLNCELSRDEFARRIHRYTEGNFDSDFVKRLNIFNMNIGFSIDDVTRQFIDKVTWGDQKLLIVVDSVNRAIDLSQEADGTNENYWGLLRKWSMLAMQSRRHSHGTISWLMISELNRAGETKGQSLEYIADLVVRLQRTDIENMAKIDIEYSRSTPDGLIGDGMFVRDFARSRFLGSDD
jgi:predicted ATP-dependent serine protease